MNNAIIQYNTITLSLEVFQKLPEESLVEYAYV